MQTPTNSDLENIGRKAKMYEDLINVYVEKSDYISMCIHKTDEKSNLIENELQRLNYREELILLQDKIYNAKQALETWKNRMEVYKRKFEFDSEQSNIYYELIVAKCEKIRSKNNRINIALVQLPNHDVSNQQIKNDIYGMLRNELIQYVYESLPVDKSTQLRSINVGNVKEITDKILELL